MKNLHFICSKKSIAKLLVFFLIINAAMYTDALVNQSEAAPIINDMSISTSDEDVSVYGMGDGNGVDLADKPFRYSIGSSQSEWVRDTSNILINESLTSGALTNTQILNNSLILTPDIISGSSITTGEGLEGYACVNTITIDHTKIDSELTNFPATVYLNNSNFDFTKAKFDGSDIRFTDKDLNPLKFEREEHSVQYADTTVLTEVMITESGIWTVPAGVTQVDVFLVGGGGGGGNYNNGAGVYPGGGGGGYTRTFYGIPVVSGSAIPVTIGAGGLGSSTSGTVGSDGGNTKFLNDTYISLGGKGGGAANGIGGAGGSGGGGCHSTGGTNGGNGLGTGGAGQGTSTRAWGSATGTLYSGGGGGGTWTVAALGGAGGGGAGSGYNWNCNGSTYTLNGTPNTGGGGGGRATAGNEGQSGNGGSGVIIVRYTQDLALTGQAIYNVLIPEVSNLQDTDIYMWYGNPNAYNTSIESWQDQTGKQLTYNGNVKLAPNAAKFGKALYSASQDNRVYTDTNFTLGTTWAFDFNVYFNNVSSQQNIFDVNSHVKLCFVQYFDGRGLTLHQGDGTSWTTGYTLSSGFIPQPNKLYHYAVTCDGTTIRFFVDGNQIASTTNILSSLAPTTITKMYVASCAYTNSTALLGYFDEFRFSNIARWTSNFIPSQEPYTADDNTKLLMHFDGFDSMRMATSTTGTNYYKYTKTSSVTTGKTTVIENELRVEAAGTGFATDLWIVDTNRNAVMYIKDGSIICNAQGSNPYIHVMDTKSADHTYRIELQGTAQAVFKVDGITVHTASYTDLQATSGSYIAFGDPSTTANYGGSVLHKAVRYNLDYVANPTNFVEWNPSKGLPTAMGWEPDGSGATLHLTFNDETGKSVYTYGDVKSIKTAYADGARSAYFDGSGDYLSCANNTSFALTSTEDYTLEANVIFNSTADMGIFQTNNALNVGNDALWFGYQSGKLVISKHGSTSYVIGYSWTPILGKNYHLQAVRNNGTIYLFVDGALVLTNSTTHNGLAYSQAGCTVGVLSQSTTPNYFNGYILGVRFTKHARNITNFTPATKFEIDGSDVIFCTNFDTIYDQNYAMVQHMGDTLVDATGNGNNGTATGTTVVNTEYGKARYFNGSSDSILVATSNIVNGSTAHTLLMFTKPTSTITINTEATSGTSGLNGQRYAVISNGADMIGTGLSVGTNAIGAYEHAPEYMPCLLSHSTTTSSYSSIAIKYINRQPTLYINGFFIKNGLTSAQVARPSKLYFGGGSSTNSYMGELLCARLSSISRSDAWIKAESLSLKNELLTFAMYPTTGSRESEVYDVSGHVNSSSLQWTQTVPTGTGITVESNVSLDGGSSWIGWKTCTSGAIIADLDGSTDTSSARLKIRQTLSTSSGAITPSLSNSIININLSKYEHQLSAEPNKAYDVTFQVKDANGSITSETRTVYTKAQSPQFTVSNKTINTIDLLFTDSNPVNTEYQIMCDSRYVNSSGVLTSVPTWITLEDKAITVLGLNIGTMYNFAAKARNTAEEETNYGSPIYAGTDGIPVPSGSAAIAATALNNSVTVAWNEIPNSLNYELEMDGIAKTVGLKTNYVHKDLMTGTQHTYRIRGKNLGGYSDWSELCIINTTSNLPLIPINALAKASDDTVTIYWDPAQDALTYTVEISGRQITDVKKNSATLFGLQPETSYTYKVKAVNLIGESEWTAEGSITTHFLETPKITLKQTDSHEIKIGWNKIEGATSYKIALDADDNFKVLSGSQLEQFASSSAITYTHENLPIKTAHVYRVCAMSADGDSAWSDSITLETLPQRPDVPTNFNGSASSDFITLIWNAVQNAIGYDIEVDGIIVENDNVTEYQYKGLGQYTTHTYRVRSVTDEIESAWSNILTISTSGGVPDVPKNVVIESSRGIATLNWDETDGAQYYDVKVGNTIYNNIAFNAFTHRQIGLITSSSSIYTEIPYQIRAGNDLGTSEWSDYYINNAIRGQIEKGKELDLGLTASNITDFSRYTLNVTYNEKALTVTDLCAYSVEKELSPGMVEGYDIEIVSFVPGHIIFKVNKIVDEGYMWTGIINNIKFTGNATGGTTLTYTVQCVKD